MVELPAGTILAIGNLINIASLISNGKVGIVSSGGNTGRSHFVVEFLWEDTFSNVHVAVPQWLVCLLGCNATRAVTLSMVSCLRVS